jgi:chorismate mutase
MDDLERLREEIGALDRTVLETLNQRLELVKRVNRHKQQTGAPLIDAAREAELLRELAEANTGPLSERAVQGVFAAVLDVMKQELRGDGRPAEAPRQAVQAAVGSLAVVGTGLLGASVALAAKRAGVARVTGWDADPETLREALGAKALDGSAGSLADAVAGAELVVVAVPVGYLVATTHDVLAAVGPERPSRTSARRSAHSRRRSTTSGSCRGIRSPATRPAAPPAPPRISSTARRGSSRPSRLPASLGSSSSSDSSRPSVRARSGSTMRPTTGCSP